MVFDSLRKDPGRQWVAVAAPMVRYSKLPFRELVKRHGTDIAYTPMILADSFVASAAARNQEFTVDNSLSKDVVQFAAKDKSVFATAAALVKDYAAGVDLNCGCPQRWAIQEGIGSALLKDSELMYSMIRHAREALPDTPLSVKIRILGGDPEGYAATVELARRMEAAGASYITVHGRTPRQRPSDPVDYDAIGHLKRHTSLPVIANGDVFTRQDAENVYRRTGVDGIMAARGLLSDPALFSTRPEKPKPLALAKEYIDLALAYGTLFHTLHHHTSQILTEGQGPGLLPAHQHKRFNSLTSTAAVIDFLNTAVD